MNVKIHEPTQIVEVMLTHAEQADEEVKKQLKELYAQYKGTKYTVAVFLCCCSIAVVLPSGHNISENALHGLVDSRKCLWRVIEKYFGEKPQKKCEKCCRCRQKSV